MYDWANSVYALTITSAIFPVYYANITSTNGTFLYGYIEVITGVCVVPYYFLQLF
ncbi:hypothetical protein SAMN06265350_102191 [Solitalea koreensis]|uniref:Uncharacterized protein n=2 Tax=Solitalea koreensis TaxID=543615 RepID=A0A521BGS1_9SPHI|nr:hypothetical protein SAMN06265350_102191 [Solitalea koreensis]